MNTEVWWDKYRPTTIKELALSDENLSVFGREDFDLENCANLLFVGPPGTGKTTLAKIIAKDYDYLYINASDAGGVDVVRSEITDFIRSVSMMGTIKVIILDEASGMSSVGGSGSSAQEALRNVMEENLDNARFILTVNEQHKLLPALQSRCQTFNFALTKKQCASVILGIAKAEGVTMDLKDLKEHLEIYAPDLRKCIGEFQKGVADGVFTFNAPKGDRMAEKIAFLLDAKKDVFDIRQSVIKVQDTFQSDWSSVMREMFTIYAEKKALQKCILIADHIYKDTSGMDREVNFSSLLFLLSQT